jgi:hypothetical protein
VEPGVVAGDGTVVEAAASRYRTLQREAAAAAAVATAAAAATPTPAAQQAAAHAQAVAALAETRAAERVRQRRDPATVQVVPSEPEAVIQPRKDGAMRPSYTPSTWTHESGLIVGQAVHPSSETAVLPQLLAQHAVVFGGQRPRTVLLDAGYCSVAVLQRLAEADIDVLCPAGSTRRGADGVKRGAGGRFGKGRFAYDGERDAYRCPGAQWLTRVHQSHDRTGRPYVRYATTACATCALRAQCTTSPRGRTVERYAGDEYKEAMAAVLQQPGARRQYRRRGAIAERPYAELRVRQGLVRFRRRGPSGAALEWALHCLAFDLKWALGRPARDRNPRLVTWRVVGHAPGQWHLAVVGRAAITAAGIRGLLLVVATPPRSR